MISRNSGLAALLCLALAACSSDGSNERALASLYDLAASRFQPADPIRVPANRSYIVLSYDGARTPMILQSEADGVARYEAPGGVRMTLTNGYLSLLRGLGQEYQALYTEADGPYRGEVARLARANETVTRVIVYWIDQQPYRDRMRCTFSFQGVEGGIRQIAERCESLYHRLTFTNAYGIDANDTLVASRQWFHPDALSVEIDHRQQRQ